MGLLERRGPWLPLLLLGATAVAYANSLSGAFVHDDWRWIVWEPNVRSLDLLPELLRGASRPVWKATLAANYALGGLDPLGYHVVNGVIHGLAVLVLYALLRRTPVAAVPEASRSGFAFATAAIWAVHPLQTQAVTYIAQRCESLMGLCFLLTLLGVARVAQGAPRRRTSAWAVAACAIGMGTKEVMVVAPLMALFYDRAFFAGSFADALRKRRGLHAALFATWIVPIGLIGIETLFRGEMARPDLETVSRLRYAASQPGVVLHYLRLVFWPHPLLFDYGWPAVTSLREALAPGLAIGLLLVGTLVALARNSALGFAGAFFFGVLAPTSSVQPIQDLAVEHRMYLPLAAVVAVGVAAALRALDGLGAPRAVRIALLALVLAPLTAATVARNRDYATEVALWRSVVAVRPEYGRGHYNLGTLLRRDGFDAEALSHLRSAVEYEPGFAKAHNNLANALLEQGDVAGAIAHYRRAIEIDPGHEQAQLNLGAALRSAGDLEGSAEAYRRALSLRPGWSKALAGLATTDEARGDRNAAIAGYARALRADPRDADAHHRRARLLQDEGRLEEAVWHYRAALALDPAQPRVQHNLGTALHSLGDLDGAIEHYQEALRLAPDYARAKQNLESARRERDARLRGEDEAATPDAP